MKPKTKTKTATGMADRRHDWDASDHNERPQDARTIANAMRDYAESNRANGARVPFWVLESWAEWVEGREPMRPPTRDERIEEIRVEVKAARKAKRKGGAWEMEGRMKTRRLLAHAWEIPGFLDGTKTQFRRPVKPHPVRTPILAENGKWYDADCIHSGVLMKPPLGQPGDGLWVAEVFTVVFANQGDPNETQVLYRASSQYDTCESFDFGWTWTPANKMFHDASRLTLEITAVRVERVQEITEEDAKADGVAPTTSDWIGDGHAKACFSDIWQSIYGTWDANPWVWVYEFRRVKP